MSFDKGENLRSFVRSYEKRENAEICATKNQKSTNDKKCA